MQSYFDSPYAVALRRNQPQQDIPSGGGSVGGTRLFNPNGGPVVQEKQPEPLMSQKQSDMMMKGLKQYAQNKGWLGGAPAYSNLATTGAGSSAAMTNAMLAAPAGSSASAGYGLYSGAPIGAQAAGFGGWSSGLGAAGTGAEAGLYGGGAASAGGLGGGAGAAGGGAAAGGGGALAATGWGALLAAVIALNERDSRKRGLRADSSSERHKDLWTGKSFPQDMQGKWGPMFDRWSNGSFSKIGGTDFATSAGQAAFGRFGPARKSLTSGLHRVGDVFQKIF